MSTVKHNLTCGKIVVDLGGGKDPITIEAPQGATIEIVPDLAPAFAAPPASFGQAAQDAIRGLLTLSNIAAEFDTSTPDRTVCLVPRTLVGQARAIVRAAQNYAEAANGGKGA